MRSPSLLTAHDSNLAWTPLRYAGMALLFAAFLYNGLRVELNAHWPASGTPLLSVMGCVSLFVDRNAQLRLRLQDQPGMVALLGVMLAASLLPFGRDIVESLT